MVVEIDASSGENLNRILEKVREAQHAVADAEAEKRKAAKLAAFGKVKWDEDPLAYQRRLRDEWE